MVRDVTLDIAARAELPNVAVPENIIDGGLGVCHGLAECKSVLG